jgi:hypothetical protein
MGMEGCRTANPWDFLSKPSFKITAKGKRHRNEPMACDFGEICALPLRNPRAPRCWTAAGFRSITEKIDTIIPPGRIMMQMIGEGRIGGRRKKLDTAIWRETARLYDISQPTM